MAQPLPCRTPLPVATLHRSGAVFLEQLRELCVRESAVARDQIALVDAEKADEHVLRLAAVADSLLVADLDDVDVRAPADADSRGREAVGLDPARAPALAEALEIGALATTAAPIAAQTTPNARPR
jgi:hypothetical protein